MDKETIRGQLLACAEPTYRAFSAKLLPTVDAARILGVRLPVLRKMAQQIARADWRAYLAAAGDDSFEEIMLQGMVIGCAEEDIDDILPYVAAFVPKIDNWSVCDSFCNGLKCFNADKERGWEFLQPYFASDAEYEVRFAVVILISFYIEPAYLKRIFPLLDQIKQEGYYVKMAVAWALSICYIKQPELTMSYLRHNALDDFTYNKTLQKITESLKVEQETKALIRSMKRKG